MKKQTIHTIAVFIACVVIFMHGGGNAAGQELNFPERWQKEFSSISPLFRNDTITICFLGDVMMHARQIEDAHRGGSEYDFSTYFMLIRDRIRKADLTVANMEFSLGGEPYTGYPVFSAPDPLAEQMAECGIDIFLAANNHIYDKGKAGAERTLEIYRRLRQEHGIAYTGLSGDEQEERMTHPLIRPVKGIRVAFVNFTYATNGGRRNGWPKVNYMDSRDDISLALETARRKHADITIALPHWGNEYELTHSSSQEETARWLVSEGADIIIGTHPHVIQDTTMMTGKDGKGTIPVIYSLGNAVSNMSARNTQLELMATVRITRDTKGRTSMLPPELTFLWCSRPGGFNDSFTVIPVEEYLDKKAMWQNEWDYMNMVETYRRVRKITGTEQTEIHE